MAEVQTLARGLKILEKLAEVPEGLGITELANAFGVDKGSMSRILQTFTAYGFTEKDSNTRKYILGPQVVSLSRAVLTRMPLREMAKPYLQEMVDQTGECAHLAILARGEALYIDQVESQSALRVTTSVGTLAPLHCTALGKIFLAYGVVLPLDSYKSYTFRTITDPVAIRNNVEQVKKQGYAIDDEEYNIGVRCIAVPVFDYRNRCVASIGVSGPASRLPLENIANVVETVREIGRALSSRLSYKPVK